MRLSVYQHDYGKPQDNGNRCDVNFMILSSESGKSVRIESDGLPLCIRAWDYGEEDLENAAHPYQLKRRDFVNVNVDLDLHGVGGIDTWGSSTLDKYTVKGISPHSYSFILSAL